MAEELLGWDLGILKARGDLSSSQHRFVQISGAKFAGISSAGTEPDGILQNKPASGPRTRSLERSTRPCDGSDGDLSESLLTWTQGRI